MDIYCIQVLSLSLVLRKQWYNLYMCSENLIPLQPVLNFQHYLRIIILQINSPKYDPNAITITRGSDFHTGFCSVSQYFYAAKLCTCLHKVCPHLYISLCHPPNLVPWQHSILLTILSPGLWDINYVRVSVCNQKLFQRLLEFCRRQLLLVLPLA